ncbi:MAG: histidinol-phosphate transaminase [Gammaproteobacteria bacterium]
MTKQTPETLIKAQIRALSSYHVPNPDNMVKLDAMENPYRWPDELVDKWLEVLQRTEINRYPDPSARQLEVALRSAMQIPDNMAVLLGNGSDELIQMLVMAVAEPGRVVLAPEPTFVMYRMIARVLGMTFTGVPLRDDFSLDTDAMLAAIKQHDPALIFLAYPNNPTGNLFSDADIVRILEQSNGLVILDEAYAPFTDASFMSRLGEYDNLLVLRTVSKMGLAGLRLGFLVGPAHWLNEIDKTRLPYNINALTQDTALFAMDHIEVLMAQAQHIRNDRSVLLDELRTLSAVMVYPSEANFILFRLPKNQGQAVFDALKEKGILIKNLSAAGAALSDCLRVTVGTAGENRAFIHALKDILRE